ncbi:hypothetical protein [Usitatibacter palustris]|uniref:Uncharacterized protein n=1 Tax=Usitatibacter palustris TaxID=2732487 RepID=A0A6M4HE55_9PROT|nr:hypothetical protein [Usitatibacter palustris]QJR16267.1 hypothetical protein DSM104440_03096 [Usitatibacter palustris]
MRTAILGYILATLLAVTFAVSLAPEANAKNGGKEHKTKKEPAKPAEPAPQFCWRDSYGRGAGTIPSGCGSGQNDAGLCYNNCNAGYTGVGPLCWPHCPPGFSDHGVGCTKPAAYGRGGGYPWHGADGFSDSGMLSRCRAANPAGCEMDGAIAYPVCKPGFRKIGCCICSPSCPAGFTDTGATCVKASVGRGVGTVPTSCAQGQQNDAGLCYPNCKAGYSGVGPVCWGNCPAGMTVGCGMGCANTSKACQGAVTDQALTVVELVATIALAVPTGGASVAAKAAAKTSAVAATKAASKGLTKEAVRAALLKASKDTGKALTQAQLEEAVRASTGEDWDPYSLDPTGIAQIVKAYNHKTCGK